MKPANLVVLRASVAGCYPELNSETFTAAASACCIWIDETEPFPVEAVAEIEFCATQVQKTFHVANHFKAVVEEFHIARFGFVVEV
jgi:hypothetical protein